MHTRCCQIKEIIVHQTHLTFGQYGLQTKLLNDGFQPRLARPASHVKSVKIPENKYKIRNVKSVKQNIIKI